MIRKDYMSATLRLQLRQKQKLGLTPALRGSLELLRMPTDMLNDEIAREATENPFLEVRQPGKGGGFDFALATVAGDESLSVSLARQIDLQHLDGPTRAAALFLVGQLREDGYLDISLTELAADTGLMPALLERGLDALHRCEPTGVGARDLAECLTLQLIDMGYAPPLAAAITAHLDDFAANQFGRAARHLGLPLREIKKIGRDIRGLSPHPVSERLTPIVARVPELLVERGRDGGLGVSLNPDALPTVAVVGIGPAGTDSHELRHYLDRAANLTRSIRARGQTLLRIGRHIVERQSGFFLHSPATILPESRAEAAVALGMHASTFGRALAGKALAIDGKVHALAEFFSRALPTTGGAISAHDIRIRIRALILAEDSNAPLADDTICSHFKKEGVDIARRTVAKYRKCMRIPTSFERRRRSWAELGAAPTKTR